MRAGKRALSWIVTVIMVITMLPFSQATVMADSAPAATIYVATSGDDTTGDGTQAKPYKSIAKAKEVVRTLPKTNGDIVVQIADGFYPNDETLVFDKNDSGNENCTIRYEAAPGAKPVISGGKMLDKGVWTEATGLTQTGGLTAYKTTLNRTEKLRAIYVNDKRANMTLSPTITSANRTTTGTPTVSFNSTGNDWVWQNGSGIRAAIVFTTAAGISLQTKNPQNIEAESVGGSTARWARPFVCFASVEAAPEASGKPGGVMLRFQMPYAAISQSLSNNTQYNPGNDQVIRNAFEFFNKRGDFYFDQAENTLYYIPLEGEDINTADVVIPKLETVVDIRGIPVGDRLNPIAGSDDGRVKNITFDGLTFAHTDYKLYELTGTYTLSDGSGPVTTSSRGFASVQGCIVNKVYFPSNINWHETFYRGYDIPPAAVMVNAARNIKIMNGEIGLTGFNGIHLENDVKNCEVTGNYIVDTLSSGVVVGHPQHIYENDEAITHESIVSVSGTPIRNWAGVDKEKYITGTEAVPQDIYITNNFLYRNCYGFPGANSLTSFYTTNMQVLHNFLYDSTYGAMSIGWGWCEYDGYGYHPSGTDKTGTPFNGTSENSLARSPEISTTSRNNKINYNRVEEICTVVNDSGAIYSLGRQGDPGNLPDGGMWDTVKNVPTTPVTDTTSNWHPDNWTNFTEMNYNFLNPNPQDKPTSSNNWTNGFHPDEGSTFIKMIGNVVQSKLSHSVGRSRLYEFNNWKRKSDMIAVGGYVDGDNDQNGGPRITFDNYKSVDRVWPVEGNKIVLESGLTNEYTHMIPKSLIADTEFELASNVVLGKSEPLNRRGLLKAEDTVWLAPAGTTVFAEDNNMTKAAGDAQTINAPSAPGAYKLFIVYEDGRPTATSKYTAYVDTSATSVNVENGKSYEVSAVHPLKLTLSDDYTYTLNGNPINDGHEIATEGSWDLILSTPTSTNAPIKFTTKVTEANKLLSADKTVAPGGTVRFAFDLNDPTKKIWISSPSGGHFDGGDDETMTSGNKLGITAPIVPGTYIIYVLSKDDEVLSQSHARVVVDDSTPVDTSVDKTLLNDLIGATGSLDSASYTTNSWNAFASALSAAQAAASNVSIGQEAADNSYFALRNAFKALRIASDIFIEAESATVVGPFSGRSWSPVKGQYTQAMQASPDSGYSQSSTTAANLATTPRLSYNINIPEAGNYTVWALCKVPNADGDSLHIGLDNTFKFTANGISDIASSQWIWLDLKSKLTAGTALENVAAGNHTLDIWFREDGLAVDRIFLTKSTLTSAPVWLGQTAVLDKASLTLTAGTAVTLSATVTPAEEADKTVVYTSSNEAVATVTGKTFDEATGTTSITVNAVAAGSAIITATTANGAQTTCNVTVEDNAAPTWPAGSSLTVSAIGVNSVTLNWTPATDNLAVTGYDIYKGAQKLNTVAGNVNTYSVTGLTEGTIYTFAVQAKDQAGNISTDGPTITVTTLEAPDTTVPTWPAGSSLTASAIGVTAVTLNWTPATDNKAVTGYDIYKGTEKLATVAGNVSSYEVTGLTAEATYTFAVQAADQANNVSTDGPTITVTTLEAPDTTVPTWPAGSSLTASAIGMTAVTLNWTPATDNKAVTGYDIYKGTEKLATVAGNVSSYEVTGLTAGAIYTFAVQAADQANNVSTDGPIVTLTTQADDGQGDTQAPTWPAGSSITASAITKTEVTISWPAAQDDTAVTGYVVYNGAEQLASVDGSTTTQQITGLTAGTTYTLTVKAKDGSLNWSAGLEVSITTQDNVPQDSTAPVWPIGSTVTASAISTNGLTLTWSAAQDDTLVTGYRIYRGSELIGTVAGNITSYNVTGLSSGTNYTFKIEAGDSAGNWSTGGPTATATTDVVQTPYTPTPSNPQPVTTTTPGSIQVTAPVVDTTKGTATVSVDAGALNKALTESKVATVEIPKASGVEAYVASLPAAALASGDATKTLKVSTEIGTIAAPLNMLTAAEVAGASKVELSIGKADISELDNSVKAAIGDKPVVELNIKVDGNIKSWSNPNAAVTVKIPYTPTAVQLANTQYLTVWYIDANGKAVQMKDAKYVPSEKAMVFTTTHFSKYAVAYTKKNFDDMQKHTWAVEATEALASEGIIEGTSDTGFSPAKKITRAEYLAWLVRTLKLTAEFDTNFSDIKETNKYYNEIGIAKALGITVGFNGKFSPDKEISRQDMSVMTIKALKLAEKTLSIGAANDIKKYTDAKKIAKYAATDFATMVKMGFLTGNSKTTLNPTGATTRAEAAVILYKIFLK